MENKSVKISFIDADSPVNLFMNEISIEGENFYYIDFDKSTFEMIRYLKSILIEKDSLDGTKYILGEAQFVDLSDILGKKVIAIKKVKNVK